MTTQRSSFDFELKAIGPREFEGYGSIFGNEDLGGDIVVPGAFAKTLAEHKAAGTMPLMFWMHQADQVPGVWLDMQEDRKGLYVRGELVDTALGRDVRTLLQKKAVRGLSIGYRPLDTDWHGSTRLLKQVGLAEVSIVSTAMNPLAAVESIKARLSASGEYVPTPREFEEHFRKMGCSRNVARDMAAKLFKGEPGANERFGGHQREAGEFIEESEEKAAAEALWKLFNVIGAQAISRS